MWIRQILVAVVGLASGFAVAAGLFSFIIGLGVVSDFADRTHTGKHVMLYENCIMAGGILGNIFWVYGLAMPGGKWIVPVFGLFSGIFRPSTAALPKITGSGIPGISNPKQQRIRKIRRDPVCEYTAAGVT